ncbi:hypothetical protein T4C_7373 [Trichinella pseudospiralis]|uniref:Uncharacterized protein n=1 Tax=Trichinella pseudospiralis TaxID=6337 RepID=A0A0V1JK23_TRIPS|nr:hypothetical protein T4C_7373 [Trichinella pseudospiralis]
MQITIATMVLYHQYREWRREKNKNADDTVQKSIDGTKQIKRIQEAYMDNGENERGRHEADRGRHEAELWMKT